jgi:Flp pilus assembly protein TadG
MTILNSRTNNVESVSGKKMRITLSGWIDKQARPGSNLVRGEEGQAFAWMVLLVVLFLGICALTIDLGHALLVKRELQASCDAAAMAAAQTLPSTNYAAVAQTFSSAHGSMNEYGDFSVGTPTVTPLCLSTVASWGVACSATNPNAVSVRETATIRTFFAGVIGMNTMTVTATATAAHGAKPKPYNVAIILDTTPSMDYQDNDCGKTQLQCATDGVQQLLKGLAPSLDSVSLFTFPNITTTSVSADTDCSSSKPTTGPYTFPSSTATSLTNMSYTAGSSTTQMTYQVTGYLKDYRSSDSSTSLATNSSLANAVGVGSSGNGRSQHGCTGIQTSMQDTYYAGAIYAAQASLMAQKAANAGTENVIILLSDGNATAKVNNPGGAYKAGSNDMVTSSSQSSRYATASGIYPSWVGQCGQGVDAANYAKSQGTIVYTIAYGSPSTSSSQNCASDRSGGNHPYITPCQAMQQMSSGWSSGDYSHFFSDYNMTGGDAGCQASGAQNGVTALDDIFKSIQIGLAGARLIPNDTP